jgi:hypothetical protein
MPYARRDLNKGKIRESENVNYILKSTLLLFSTSHHILCLTKDRKLPTFG